MLFGYGVLDRLRDGYIYKVVCYSSQEEEARHAGHERPHGEAAGLVRRKGRISGENLYSGFCGKDQARQGKLVRTGWSEKWLGVLGHKGCP